MTDNFFHGARVKENTDLQTAINDIDSTVIGLVAVAEDADPTFPLDTPVLLRGLSACSAKQAKPARCTNR
jgi:phage tail sheath protein FI